MEKLTKEDLKNLSEKELNDLLKERLGLLVGRFRPELSEGERKEVVEKMISIVDKTIEEVKVLEDLEKKTTFVVGKLRLDFSDDEIEKAAKEITEKMLKLIEREGVKK